MELESVKNKLKWQIDSCVVVAHIMNTLDAKEAKNPENFKFSKDEFVQMILDDVYGIVSETYTEDKKQIDYDSCWGYFGYEYAQEAMKTDL